MVISKETLQAHISRGDRQSDAARAHGISRNRISQLTKLYELNWPRATDHQHGDGLRPKYRKGCEKCKDIVRELAAERRAKRREPND